MPEPIRHTFDLPVPPSVNRTRKVDWPAQALRQSWKGQADMLVLAQARGKLQTIEGQFEAIITLRDGATCMQVAHEFRNPRLFVATLREWPSTRA